MFDLGTAAAAANPYAAIGSALLGGGKPLFSSNKSSTVAGHATGYSGIGAFSVDGDVYFPGKPLFDLENPVHILVAGGLVILTVYAAKRVRGRR